MWQRSNVVTTEAPSSGGRWETRRQCRHFDSAEESILGRPLLRLRAQDEPSWVLECEIGASEHKNLGDDLCSGTTGDAAGDDKELAGITRDARIGQ
ncbi:MAG: hypothetical protein IT422_00440 [Pirellulaceae bacterium]|nr:hypothetical protein [Pirellulaceae bacterium]